MPRKTNRKPTSDNRLRIIGGAWRGRKLAFPDEPGLRPTPDRIRETLFNWLQPDVIGSHCLDLFSGSGALGLEALSRGAKSALLIDLSARVTKQLQANLTLLGADNGRVETDSALRWLSRARNPDEPCFDLVFLDPPFRQDMLEECCDKLEKSGHLSASATIYIEAERQLRHLPVPAHWELLRSKDAGQVSCYLFRRQPQD